GVVFLCFHRDTTPASRTADASRYFLDRSATPPRPDARRGISLDSNVFTMVMTCGPCRPRIGHSCEERPDAKNWSPYEAFTRNALFVRGQCIGPDHSGNQRLCRTANHRFRRWEN